MWIQIRLHGGQAIRVEKGVMHERKLRESREDEKLLSSFYHILPPQERRWL